MSYWYHFAIMFEALFILTTIDAGTRIARFVLQEMLGKVYKPFGNTTWLPGNLFTSAVIVLCWGYFIYTGTVGTIWPMFGAANQLMATIALVVGTTYIINRGRARYAWVTILPMAFVGITTLYAAITNVATIYFPQMLVKATFVPGLINFFFTVMIIICLFVIFINALPKWYRMWNQNVAQPV
jgi:carbon starvation protein